MAALPAPAAGRRRPLDALPRPFSALRRTLAGGYRAADLKADLAAGAVVGTVAVPLSMALAVASGMPPQYGLYTAIVAGAVTALAGGSPLQVSGPTAAFVVLLAPVAATHGPAGLLTATLLAGLLLVAMALAGLGRLMRFVPYPVTLGFTAGIAVVIATLQLRDLLGLEVAELPEHWAGKVASLAAALPTFHAADLAVAAATLALLVAWPRLAAAFAPHLPAPFAALLRLPGPLVALAAGGLLAAGLAAVPGDLAAVLLRDRFSWRVGGLSGAGIPPLPPVPGLPWAAAGGAGGALPSFDLVRELLPPAFAIAILGAIESLLSAVVADGMAGTDHDPDGELLGQGIGNLVAPFFGGFAATGAIARTATNVRSGARTPLAAVFHALFVLAVVLALAPLLGFLPMASLAALLLVVAWNMAEARHVVRVVRTSPRSDVAVLLTCFGLTVLFDMVVAVGTGVVLAALLFMRRMAEVSGVSLAAGSHPLVGGLPPSVVVYEVAGPLFFGAASKAMGALSAVDRGVRVVLFDLSSVPAMDATGLVALEAAVARLEAGGIGVVMGGLQPQPLRTLLRAGWRARVPLHRTLENAVARASRLAEAAESPAAADAA
jgi:SulP family sulfate permease